jgi:hypothetical protein
MRYLHARFVVVVTVMQGWGHLLRMVLLLMLLLLV